ncbi:MAG TPA: SagB family peptide dehydrogenase [Pirellulales bacterium]|jgi:SagB-type dehydrogenase family enzyme
MDPTWVLSLPEYVSISAHTDGELTLLGIRIPFTFRQMSPGLRDALGRLAAPGESAQRLAEHVCAVDGATALARWYYHLQDLARRSLLRLSVHAGGDRLATMEPTAPSFILPPAGTLPDLCYVLSRFAWVQRHGEVLVLESPLSPARIVLDDPRAAALVHSLTHPGTVAEVGGRVTDLPTDAVAPLLGLLVHAGAACAVDDQGVSAEDVDPALRFWQFHDLLFHARSRQGRHDGPVGATYPQAGRLDPPPAFEPETGDAGIALHRPDLERAQREDPPFALVQQQRRSIRNYASKPITDRQLGEFLYRVARVTDRQQRQIDTPAGPVQMDFALRPYPAGGALYELDVYAAVAACGGLLPGLYRYDGVGHRLMRRAGRTAEVDRLLADAAQATGLPAMEPQVLLVLAARMPRVAWKYTGLAYALILKDVGVIFQTMYLAATAMGLAPCAIGLGDSDLFAQAAGVDYYAETSVGEFLLGSAPSGSTAN